MISNLALEKDARTLGFKDWRGVYSKDKLPNPMPPGKYIANMQDSIVNGRPGKGTHWVYLDVGPDRTFYIDPFGVYPPPVIVDRSKRPIHYSTKQVEDADSNLCGYYCLHFAYQHDLGRSYQEILDDFKTFPYTKGNRFIIDREFGIRSK